MVFFAAANTAQVCASTPTRTDTPRESGAWVVNLAHHVEPRCVSRGQTAAWFVMGLCVCFLISIAIAGGGQ
jgi:hypothetical protein